MDAGELGRSLVERRRHLHGGSEVLLESVVDGQSKGWYETRLAVV
jgi:hypothetical protein